MPRTLVAIVILLLLSPFATAQTTQPSTQPSTQPTARPRVMIISVDGLRPDLLLRCKTPTIRSLFENGSYSFWARTVPHAITLPSHVSMLTGVVPRKHKIGTTTCRSRNPSTPLSRRSSTSQRRPAIRRRWRPGR